MCRWNTHVHKEVCTNDVQKWALALLIKLESTQNISTKLRKESDKLEERRAKCQPCVTCDCPDLAKKVARESRSKQLTAGGTSGERPVPRPLSSLHAHRSFVTDKKQRLRLLFCHQPLLLCGQREIPHVHADEKDSTVSPHGHLMLYVYLFSAIAIS